MSSSKTGRISILLTAVIALLAVSLPGAATAKDRNKDRIPDRWEKAHKLSLKKDQRKLDQDRDGLRNRGEWRSGTNPRDKDSDDDGTTDARENAGFISSYDAEAQTLTLTLYGGGEISGAVTGDTRVECESEDVYEDESGTDDSDSRHGSSGPGGSESEDESSDDEGYDDSNSEDESDDHGDEGDCEGGCSLADLAEGVKVLEADVRYTSNGAVFTKLEIEAPVAAV